MTSLVVAKKDFQDAVRSRLLWGLTTVFVLLIGGLAYGYATVDFFGNRSGSIGFILLFQGNAGLFISVAGLLVGYKAIAGERESGTISFLLGLPHSRRDVVVGKVLGRTAVLAVALLVAFVVGGGVLVGFGSSFEAVQFALFVLLTGFYAATFVSIAVGLSAMTGTASRAGAAAVGFWLFNQFWGVLTLAVLFATNGFEFPSTPFPDWYHVLSGIGPGTAYGNAAGYLLPSDVTAQVQGELGGLPEWYGLVVLAGWLLIPLGLGLYRFERADL